MRGWALAVTLGTVSLAAAQPPTNEKAVELFRAGKFDDALKELQTAAKSNPKLPPARVTLAALFLQAGKGPVARLNLEQAAIDDPKHPAVYLMNASFAFGESRFTDAILSCELVLKLAADPRWDAEQRKQFLREARLGLAVCSETRRDWVAAREHLSAVLADEPKNGILRTRLGNALFFLGKQDEAYASYREAYANDPAAELPELRMAMHYASNETLKADDWMKKALANHPQNARAPRTYAGWLLDIGKLEEAQPYVELTVRLDPQSKETATLRGMLARYRKDFPQAEKIFEELVRLSPNEAFAAWNLALILADSPDKDKQKRAVDLAEAEVRRNSQSSEAFAVLGWCYYRMGRLDEAEKAAAAGANSGSVSRDAAYFLARILTDRKKFEEAHKLLKMSSEARGGYVYRNEAETLIKELETKIKK